MKKFIPIIAGLAIIFLLFRFTRTCDRKEDAALSDFSSFLSFYEQFHSDSAFQVEHILFPLEGLPSYADSATMASGTFRWQEADWKIMRPFDASSEFEKQFIPLTDVLVVEKIMHQSGKFGMERRWAFLRGDWYLIYYAGINSIGGE